MKSAKDYLQEPYARIVIPTEPKGFHAEILEFPGCFAQGKSVQEAYGNLERAAESWIESCIAHGQEIPEPSGNLTFSGKISLRLPRGIHHQAAKMAERERTSLNTYIVSAIAARVGADDLYGLMAKKLEQQIVAAVSSSFSGTFNITGSYGSSYFTYTSTETRQLQIDVTQGARTSGRALTMTNGVK
jgi:predicted RNase H-like HicB family nuclease